MKKIDGFYFCNESPDSSLSIEKVARRKIYNEAELYVTIDFARLVKRVSKKRKPGYTFQKNEGKWWKDWTKQRRSLSSVILGVDFVLYKSSG